MNPRSRRQFLKEIFYTSCSIGSFLTIPHCSSPQKSRPNIILILTDDQGYGDLGVHGNEILKTPNLDRFARECVEFTQFYVSPVCAPTRASLMTGRYNYRTRAIDTWKGRAMMDPEEVTLAEVLKGAGYRTGIFGKWHLGGNYPMRAMDQGFDQAIVHLGGGIAQPSGPPGDGYFDPILYFNGKPKKASGYCMDIYTNEAIRFIEENRAQPFFVYLPTNTPHSPLQIDNRYVESYCTLGLDDPTAKLYGMVENIDENVGKLLRKLDQLNLTENTIVIFMSDNGPSGSRYNCNLRGSKGTVFEGGIRVPFFIRWPAGIHQNASIDKIAAHIDVLPTLLDMCNLKTPENVKVDGRSLWPVIKNPAEAWPDRTLFFQWHRGDEPQRYRCFAARNQKYKLVQAQGGPGREAVFPESEMKFELFNMENDPGETRDIADQHPEIVRQLKREYERWFDDVSATRGYKPPRIYIGSHFENPVRLTRQDWRGSTGWRDVDLGYWEVNVVESGIYRVTLWLSSELKNSAVAHFKFANIHLTKEMNKGQVKLTFDRVNLLEREGQLEAWLQFPEKKTGVRFVDLEKMQ